ncbi:alkane 1-monooxygenase [Pseudomonas solani]|uniref:alkane 1-monooxygenase n=1 Tax=Pseudomonas solani TaxID=2731552 RepID=UPI003F4AA318
MSNPWKYSAAFIHPACVGLGLWLGDWWIYSSLIVSGVVYPLLEITVPQTKAQRSATGTYHVPNAIARLAAFSIFIMVISTVTIVSTGNLSPLESIVLTYTCGLSSGIVGFTLAHEFFHRRSQLDRFVGIALLIVASYPHFYLQHLYSHHPNVAKRSDHSSSRKGESVYSFYLRTIFASAGAVWRKECSRALSRTGSRFNPVQNRAISVWVIQMSVYVLIFLTVGTWGLAVFISQGLTAVLVLETVNYIQHYGLERPEAARKTKYEWSWDNYACTNFAIFNLGYHADHHVNPSKEFYKLQVQAEAPCMPYGYFTMSALALIPPLWRWIMDERSTNQDPRTMH